jgi:putative Ca2+/H+ antiporter (TMEM165/GDT1 family)
MAIVNLGIRFLVELAGVAAVATWGLHASPDPLVGVLLGTGAAAALIVTWAVVVAPNARNRLPQPRRDLIGTGLLLVAAAALAVAGQPALALVYAAVVVVNQVLLIVLRADARTLMTAGRAGR